MNIVLTAREREVLDLVVQGFSNKLIAARLEVAEKTVKFHISSILAKTNLKRRTMLIAEHYCGRLHVAGSEAGNG